MCLFNELIFDCHFKNDNEIAKYLIISKRTLQRYKSCKVNIPPQIIKLLKFKNGDLGQIDNAFKNWWIKKNKLITPNNDTFPIFRLNYIFLTFEQFREQKNINLVLKNKIEKYENLKSMKHTVKPVNDGSYSSNKSNVIWLKT